jgi:hypothetical protein
MHDSLGDNPVIRVNGTSLERLKYAMHLGHGFEAQGFLIKDEKLAFARYPSAPEMTPFPTELGPDRCADMAWDWLQKSEYPRQPDHDGDNKKGWLLRTDGWGEVDGFGYQYFIAVEPMWIMFGK